MTRGFTVRCKLMGTAVAAGLFLVPLSASAAAPLSTKQSTISPVWGSFADLAGTTWRNPKGALTTYEWKIPNEVMSIVYYTAKKGEYTDTISLDPSGDTLTYKSASYKGTAKAIRPGVILYESDGDQQIMRITAQTMFLESIQKNGTREEWQLSRLPVVEVATAIVAKQQEHAALAAAAAAKAAVALEPRNVFQAFTGRFIEEVSNAVYTVSVTPLGQLEINLGMPGVTGWGEANENVIGGISVTEIDPPDANGVMSSRIIIMGKKSKGGSHRLEGRSLIAVTQSKHTGTLMPLQSFELMSDGNIKTGSTVLKRLKGQAGQQELATVARRGAEQHRTWESEQAAAEAAAKQAKREAGGGGFLKVLQGAVGGLQGMADAGAGMSEALAGAAIGAAAGAAGVDATAISQSMYEGSAKVKQDNDRLKQMGDDAIADGLARGTAEYNRRQAAAGRPVKVAEAAPVRSDATSSSARVVGASSPPPAASRSGLETAFTYCSLYGQHANGKNWQFYISEVGEIQSRTGEHWPATSEHPIARRWAAHLNGEGANVAQYDTGQNRNRPKCYAQRDRATAQKYRDGDLSRIRNGSGGYTVHELSWAPSGEN